MGDSVGDPNPILDEAASGLDEPLQRAHRGTLGSQRLELVPMPQEQLERDLCVGGVVLGMARGERSAILREHVRVDRKQNEEVVLQKRRDDRTAGQLDCDRDRLSPEPLLERARPWLDGSRSMLEHGALETLQLSGTEADVVFAIRPIKTDEGSKLVRTFGHGTS